MAMIKTLIALIKQPIVGQLLRFFVAGLLSFIIDYGLFLLLVRVGGMNYALAAAISFTLSVIFNWAINTRWVFSSSKVARKSVEMIIFILIAVVGLAVNELVLWIGVERMSISAEIAKLIATVLVAIWNFVVRKWLLYR